MSSTIGDPVPPALAAYYRDLDAGRLHQAAGHFATDAVYAIPWAGGVETDPRQVFRGRGELGAWFDERGARDDRHCIQLCVHEGDSCLVEGQGVDRVTNQPFATFVASAQLGDDGLIDRYLAYRAGPQLDPRSVEGVPGDALAVLDRYFEALDSGAFAEAAEQFSADVVYSHPPYRHTGIDGNERVVFRGREQLLAAFTARGRQSFDHRIVASGQRGPHCLVEGLVEGLPGGRTGSFISSFTLGNDGRIRRYTSFYCEPSLARA
jgi:ketosteroid isomerase-like protein